MEDSERARGNPVRVLRPVAGQEVTQNPPTFSWPLHKFTKVDQAVQYTVQIQYPNGSTKSFSASSNWLLPRESFGPGNYRWRVIGVGLKTGGGDDISAWRDFTITADAVPFFDAGKLANAATDASWFSNIAATSHPRMVSDAYLEQLRPVIINDRSAVWAELKKRVAAQISDPAQATPHPDMSQANWVQTLPKLVDAEQDRIEGAAIVWRLLKNSSVQADRDAANAALADLKQRVFNLASWDTTTVDGQTSNTDSTVRNLLWALVVGYDHLYPALTTSERAQLVNIIGIRAGQVESRVVGPTRLLEHNPLDSHASASIYSLSAATAIMAGDKVNGSEHPQFALAKFSRYVPLAYAFLHSWGGDDGGWANGGGYGEWNVDNTYPYFDALHQVTGANPYKLQKMRNSMTYQLYARPAGGNSQAPFGDGAVQEGNQVKYYAYWWATRIPSQTTNWMASVHPLSANHDPLSRTLLSPPVVPPRATTPGQSTSSMLFASTGNVNIHSSLTSATRTSVHFKSSPYGSYNHSHADQNSFVVADQGKGLLIDSGVYDYFLSPHAKAWNRQTKAHNAITYNDGVGQRTEIGNIPTDYSATGKIIGYTDNADFTIAAGDATKAYDAPVLRSRRNIVYLKQRNVILVHDDLAASDVLKWEWNFHALTNPQVIGGAQGTVKVVNGAAQLCMKQIAGDKLTSLDVTSAYPVNPNRSFTPQYHGTWSIDTAKRQHQSVIMIDIGCKETETPVVTQVDSNTIAVGFAGKQFRFARNTLPAYSN
ncbi:heparinase II/III domain-containing protein [Chitinolyticbacter meiyuanensis]|uniref:heparinase II/III domain-containing protein n=1 Tax=Chitinolyticbacter meiyuanensis TaxID=682798 RepID=UPI0016527BEB|nr:heparinase II/III family protein [Chitinolyticbacter meiyuanensis]